MSDKTALRKIVRDKIARLTPPEIDEKSVRICECITRLPEWKSARNVCFFAPLPGEPDVELLKMEGRRACYPRVNGVDLDLYYVSDPQVMERSRWGIREPQADARQAVDLREIDLILVPGIAFSRGGGRLGRGAGFYDRLLAREGWRARKIGVGFDCQVVAELPVEAHDHALDGVVTESGWML